jgi:retron-type reverse transcriptase
MKTRGTVSLPNAPTGLVHSADRFQVVGSRVHYTPGGGYVSCATMIHTRETRIRNRTHHRCLKIGLHAQGGFDSVHGEGSWNGFAGFSEFLDLEFALLTGRTGADQIEGVGGR